MDKNEITDAICKLVADYAGKETCTPDTTFADLNLDDLDQDYLVMKCEDQHDIDLDDWLPENLETVGQLIDAVVSALAAREDQEPADQAEPATQGE